MSCCEQRGRHLERRQVDRQPRDLASKTPLLARFSASLLIGAFRMNAECRDAYAYLSSGREPACRSSPGIDPSHPSEPSQEAGAKGTKDRSGAFTGSLRAGSPPESSAPTMTRRFGPTREEPTLKKHGRIVAREDIRSSVRPVRSRTGVSPSQPRRRAPCEALATSSRLYAPHSRTAWCGRAQRLIRTRTTSK